MNINPRLPFVRVYSVSIIVFALLEILAVWSTYRIIGLGGQEAYPLAVASVSNIWFLFGTKLLALVCILFPYWGIRKYKLYTKSVFVTSCLVLGLIISVAIFDVLHNYLVIQGVL